MSNLPPGYELTPGGIAVPTQIRAAESVSVSDLRNPSAWLINWAAGARVNAGVYVNESSAMGLAAYWACLRNISEDLGKLPLLTYRRLQPRGKERATDHPLYNVLRRQPNNDMTAMDFKQLLTLWALSWGSGYAEIVRNGRGEIAQLYPVHPSRVTLRRVDGLLVYDVAASGTFRIGSQSYGGVRFQQDEILHIRGLSMDGIQGYSVCRVAAESLGLSIAAQTFGASFFANGASMSGVLEHPGRVGDVALQHVRESFKELYSGSENAGTVGILEEGMKYTKIGIPPEEAQFLETRQFQTLEVARWFRMPPHKIQDFSDAHYANAEQGSIDYVVDTLMPWCVRWEQEIDRKLFAEEDDLFAAYLLLGLLRGDQASRAAYYKARFEMGTLSPDDIRELEDENPLPEGIGQHYWIASNNYTPLEMALRGPQSMRANGANGSSTGVNGHALSYP